MGKTCCFVGCNVHSHDRRGKKLDSGLYFYCFPAWKQNEGSHVYDVTKRRWLVWISAIRCTDIHFADIPRSGGGASFVNCGFLKLLPGYLVLADRGFDIKDSVGMMCAEVQIPAFTKSRCQLDAKDVFLWLSGRALC